MRETMPFARYHLGSEGAGLNMVFLLQTPLASDEIDQ